MADQADSTPAPTGHDLTVADLNTSVSQEARVLDTRLAEALGFERPRNIRKLISRNRANLERFGEVCSKRSEPSATGGRPGMAFYLNRKQALYITAKSDTPRSAEVTIRMVEIYDQHTQGSLRPSRPVALPRPHAPKRRPKAPPHLTIDREDLAIMRVGGQTLLVDLARLEFGPDERVVCFDAAGELSVEPVRMSWPHQNWNGRRFGHVQEGRPKDGGTSHRGIWVVGGVVATLADPVRPRRSEAKQSVALPLPSRKALPSFREPPSAAFH